VTGGGCTEDTGGGGDENGGDSDDDHDDDNDVAMVVLMAMMMMMPQVPDGLGRAAAGPALQVRCPCGLRLGVGDHPGQNVTSVIQPNLPLNLQPSHISAHF
jgi:hypothetical protein